MSESARPSVDGTLAVESITATVAVPPLPLEQAFGNGRLVHPILGPYDYEYAPNEWVNLLGDVIIAPIWSSDLTLAGAAHALWAGTIQDVEIEEHWLGEGGLSMPTAQLVALLAMYQAPPDPASAWVVWYPNYATSLAYKVILTGLSVGGQGAVVIDTFALRGYVTGEVTLAMRIVGRYP